MRMARGKKRRWLGISISVALVLTVGAVSIAGYFYWSMKATAKEIYRPLPSERPRYVSSDKEIPADPEPPVTDRLSPFSVLLLGVDERRNDRGRSDTIMVMTVNPNNRTVLMFNIPRDTRTELVYRDMEDKINHAYAYDGVEGSLATVEKFLDMPIDYYVEINMEGFKQIVDTLDGVDVDNPFAFDYEGESFPAGPQHLNGEKALKYSRMRYDDPRGDFGRNDRQKQVATDIIKRATSWTNTSSLLPILDAVGDHVRTNLSFGEIQDIALKYRKKLDRIESTFVEGKGSMINGVYYYLVEQAERNRLHDLIKNQLQAES
ncbi:LCP family protein [Cohnella thailandensis]|uniref:LCP family protein n=2 Tax=Cohnella thailandensis TaxID=557557 RepID=A0A841SY16_9BACL|nr:LCP family protein [Cohnella thailandensis]